MLSTLVGLTTFSLFSIFFSSETVSNFILAKVRPVSVKITLPWGIEKVVIQERHFDVFLVAV